MSPLPEMSPDDQLKARYRFLMALLIDRGVLTNKRYSTGVWSLQGIYGVDDSGLRGAGTSPEEAIDNAILAARLNPADALTHWRDTHEQISPPLPPLV